MQKVIEAIIDPNRRKILSLLKYGDKSVGELRKHFDISGASLSHHLTKLKSADLAVSRREGQHIIYSLHLLTFEESLQALMQFFKVENSNLNRP